METSDFELCPGLVVVMNRDGIVLRTNSAAARALGAYAAQGATLGHGVHPDDRGQFAIHWLDLLDDVGQVGAISRMQKNDAATYHRYAWTAKYDADRNEIHAVFVPLENDVEETKEAAKPFRLDAPALMLHAVLNHHDVTLTAYDLEGNFVVQDGKGLASGGFHPGQFVGKNIYELYESHIPEQMAKLRKTMSNGEEFSWKVDIHDVLWDTVCAPIRDENGMVRGATMVTIDKSAIKRAMQEVTNKLSLIERQQEVIRDLETPIIQVWDYVLTLPMVGVVDSQRASRVMKDLLDMVVEKSARYAILDLTGVEIVDTVTASHLIQMITAIRLMGAEGIISGIRPTVAETLVSLGVDISTITTCANLQQALRLCIRRIDQDKRRST